MPLSEPIELYTWNGCNSFYANYPSIKLLLREKKVDALVTEVVSLQKLPGRPVGEPQ